MSTGLDIYLVAFDPQTARTLQSALKTAGTN